MNNIDKLTELNYYFLKLREILLQEGEHNYIRGINVIINRIQSSLEYNEDAKATIKSVGDTYMTPAVKSVQLNLGDFSYAA